MEPTLMSLSYAMPGAWISRTQKTLKSTYIYSDVVADEMSQAHAKVVQMVLLKRAVNGHVKSTRAETLPDLACAPAACNKLCPDCAVGPLNY
jgi:hypothetical protein